VSEQPEAGSRDAEEDGEIEHLDVVAPALMDSMRVDRALALLTGLSRSEAVRLIEQGVVSVDEHVVSKPSHLLVEGAHVEAVLPPPSDGSVKADASIQIEVAFEDDQLIVVNKSFQHVVHPGSGNREGTLISGVLARFPEIAELPAHGFGEVSRPGVVHRLDKGTSGLLVIARTPEAFASLSEQIAERRVERRYIGLVEGHVESKLGVIEAPIGRSATSPTKMAIRPDGREARTRYEVLAPLANPARTVVGLTLETGRTHQIRVHMAAIGHPIVNDPRYGQRNERRLDHDRLALHAGRLSLQHPITGDEIVVIADLPRDMAKLGGAAEANDWLRTVQTSS
jgi:23S rRNA pseudouridine1911/1915/1917 synthase